MKYLAFVIMVIIGVATSIGQTSNPSSPTSNSSGFQAQGSLPSLPFSGSNSQFPGGIPEPSAGLDGLFGTEKNSLLVTQEYLTLNLPGI